MELSHTKGYRIIAEWLSAKGFQPFAFQEESWQAIVEGQSGLVNALTGCGKTYSVFPGAIIRFINQNPGSYLHKKNNGLQLLWVTPLRALAKDIGRAMEEVFTELNIPWKLGINASYTYASGRPYYQFVQVQGENNAAIKDHGRTIDYNALGFSLNYLPNLGKQKAKSFTVLVLSVSNVFGQKNIYSYNYGTIVDHKVPVVPPSRRFVYIGCFISYGIDQTENAINNNL